MTIWTNGLLAAAALATAFLAPPADAALPNARVLDANDRSFDLASTMGKPVLVVYEDKDSAQLNAPFKTELARLAKGDKYRQAVALIPVADVRSYDYWPVRGFVKDAIRKESGKQGTTIYCDWNGDFARKLSLQKGTSNVALYSKTGRLLFVKQGILSSAEIQQALGLLKSEVDGPSS